MRLRAGTEAGATLVAAAIRLAAEFDEGAWVHDRDATFAVEHLDKLRADGYLVAPVPFELGGGGVASVHDILVASSYLAKADPATMIGVNMHLSVLLGMVRAGRIAIARGDLDRAAVIADALRRVVADDVVFAAAVSESPPQDLTRPATTARPAGDGWVVNGKKAFATMAPIATVLSVAVSYVDDRGRDRYGVALVPTRTRGVVFRDDWDALGMRASASGSVSFENVGIGADQLHDGFAAGVYSAAFLERFLLAGAFHAATSLGIAEAAHETVTVALRRRVDDALADPHAVTELAANLVDLTAMRASLDRAGHLVDEHADNHDAAAEDVNAVFAEVQAAKQFVCTAAVRVVDRALALTGGRGYLAASPLAKAWRDVRAGGFMHPVGANRAAALLARLELGAPLDGLT